MAGTDGIQGSQPVEYVEETSFASPEADAAWNWWGAVTSHSVTQGVEASTVRYLPDDSTGSSLQTLQNVKVSEMWENELTYHPQADFSELQYFTGAVGGVAPNVASLQFGEQNQDSGEYRRVLGEVGSEWSLTISEDSVAEATASFTAADGEDWSGTDYVGAGSHATEDTTTPFSYDDLGNVTYGGASLGDAVEELTLTVSNDLTIIKDPDAGVASHIVGIQPTSREITVEVSLTYDDMSMAQTVRSYNAQDFAFDVGTISFTVSNVKFPEFPYEMGPEDLIGDSISSDPADGLTWA